jgi:hypothetical protein
MVMAPGCVVQLHSARSREALCTSGQPLAGPRNRQRGELQRPKPTLLALGLLLPGHVVAEDGHTAGPVMNRHLLVHGDRQATC